MLFCLTHSAEIRDTCTSIRVLHVCIGFHTVVIIHIDQVNVTRS